MTPFPGIPKPHQAHSHERHSVSPVAEVVPKLENVSISSHKQSCTHPPTIMITPEGKKTMREENRSLLLSDIPDNDAHKLVSSVSPLTRPSGQLLVSRVGDRRHSDSSTAKCGPPTQDNSSLDRRRSEALNRFSRALSQAEREERYNKLIEWWWSYFSSPDTADIFVKARSLAAKPATSQLASTPAAELEIRIEPGLDQMELGVAASLPVLLKGDVGMQSEPGLTNLPPGSGSLAPTSTYHTHYLPPSTSCRSRSSSSSPNQSNNTYGRKTSIRALVHPSDGGRGRASSFLLSRDFDMNEMRSTVPPGLLPLEVEGRSRRSSIPKGPDLAAAKMACERNRLCVSGNNRSVPRLRRIVDVGAAVIADRASSVGGGGDIRGKKRRSSRDEEMGVMIRELDGILKPPPCPHFSHKKLLSVSVGIIHSFYFILLLSIVSLQVSRRYANTHLLKNQKKKKKKKKKTTNSLASTSLCWQRSCIRAACALATPSSYPCRVPRSGSARCTTSTRGKET